MMKESIN